MLQRACVSAQKAQIRPDYKSTRFDISDLLFLEGRTMSLGEAPEFVSPEPQRAVVLQKPKANIYTALLALSLVAIITGCICLAAELSAYNWDFNAAAVQ
jgi:hypothetical protein